MQHRRFIYLHGFASGPASGKARYFRDQLASQGVDLSIPDLAEGDFEHLTLTRQLAVIERAVRGEPVVLIGSSMGGYLAALYASRHSEVEKVVLLAPAFWFAQRWPEKLGAQAVEDWKNTGTMEVFHYGLGRPARVWWELLEDGRRYPAEPDFSQPALIFHGTADDVVPISFSEVYAASRPNVTLHMLPSDHQLTDALGPIWAVTEPFLLT